MADYTRDIIRILRANGWEFHRHGNGDHDIWRHARTGRQTVIDGKVKSRHSANAVLKQAGLPKAF